MKRKSIPELFWPLKQGNNPGVGLPLVILCTGIYTLLYTINRPQTQIKDSLLNKCKTNNDLNNELARKCGFFFSFSRISQKKCVRVYTVPNIFWNSALKPRLSRIYQVFWGPDFTCPYRCIQPWQSRLFASGVYIGFPLYPVILYVIRAGSLWEMPDLNPGPLAQKSGASPLSHHTSPRLDYYAEIQILCGQGRAASKPMWLISNR